MRWATYNRAVEKFDHYEARLNEELSAVFGKYLGRRGVFDGAAS
jgi:hypothetical protein